MYTTKGYHNKSAKLYTKASIAIGNAYKSYAKPLQNTTLRSKRSSTKVVRRSEE